MLKCKYFLHKVFHYEFWSFYVFYSPLIPIWLYYCLKNKSLHYFTAVNPNIIFGGFIEYSKQQLLDYLPKEVTPHSFIYHSTPKEKPQLDFPFIAKPNAGERGKKVELITNTKEWNIYLKEAQFPLVIQEYIDYPIEFGVFYYKLPNNPKGNILGITGKQFLTLTGNGKDTFKKLVYKNIRSYLVRKSLQEKFKEQWNTIIPKHKEIKAEPIGNHNRGTYFYDATNLLNTKIQEKIHSLCSQIPNFYYGRLDIKTPSREEFEKGNFIVLEVNGANSEATHIYDEKYNLWQAYRIVRQKLKIQEKIANYNLQNGHQPESLRIFVKALWRKV